MIRHTFSMFGSTKKVKRATGPKKGAKRNNDTDSELMRSKNLLAAKIPTPEPLTKMLHEIIYVKPFSQVNKDILRLIRRVTLTKRSAGEREREVKIVPGEEPRPELMKGHAKEGVYTVMILMQHLLRYFEQPDVAEEKINLMDKIYNDYQKIITAPDEAAEVDEDEVDDMFTVVKLIDAIGGDKSRTALAVRCIHQSIAISGHMHIKAKVCPLMTKDVRSDSGWQVHFLLSSAPHAFVQVTHTRREGSIEMPPQAHNHWELEFKVAATFDSKMKELTSTRLEITDLDLSEAMEKDLESYLTDKFKGGKLVVC